MGGRAVGFYQIGRGVTEKRVRSSTLQGIGLVILMIKVIFSAMNCVSSSHRKEEDLIGDMVVVTSILIYWSNVIYPSNCVLTTVAIVAI